MTVINSLILFAVSIGAGFVQRVSGFGLGIFSMIFLPHLMPTQTVAAMSSVLSSLTSSYNAIRYRKNIVFRTAFPMICAALISIPVAVHFSQKVSADIFHILLSIVLILLSVYFLFFYKQIRMKPNLSNAIVAGTFGGVLNGLFATGGPPIVLYLSCAMTDKFAYFATIQFYFAFTNLYATTVRIINGLIDLYTLQCVLIGAIGCLLGDSIGRKVFDKLDADKFKRVIYMAMIVSGILMLL